MGIDENTVIKSGYNKGIVDYLIQNNKLEKNIDDFIDEKMQITDMYNAIDMNKESINQNLTIKNALIKSDLVTLSVGMNDLLYLKSIGTENNSYKYLNELIKDIDELLKLIRKYCKEDILFIGAHPVDIIPEEWVSYFNKKVKILCDYYNIMYLDIENELSCHKKTKFLNEECYSSIENKIKEYIDNELF